MRSLKIYIVAAALLVSVLAFSGFTDAAPTRQNTVVTMLSAQTSTGSSSNFTPWGAKRTFYAKGTTSAGSGAATIIIEGASATSSITGDWVTLGTITLTLGTTSTSDGFASDAPWKYVRARVSAISGTGASVNVYMGGE